VGLIVPKQKHTSVERNRLKRRLRELARTRLLPVLPPVDVVVRTLPEAYGASFAALEREVGTILERLRTMSLPSRDVVASDPPAAGRKGVRRERGTP
jgi:ribonuclease P protein component